MSASHGLLEGIFIYISSALGTSQAHVAAYTTNQTINFPVSVAAQSNTYTVVANGWNYLPLNPYLGIFPNVVYNLALFFSDTTVRFSYDENITNPESGMYVKSGQTYGTMPSPFGTSSNANADRRASIYGAGIIYTPTITPTPNVSYGSYWNAVMCLGPVAYYPFNEASGNTVTDATSGHHNGLVHGGTILGSAGLEGNCGTLGNLKYVQIENPDKTFSPANTNTITAVFWAKFTAKNFTYSEPNQPEGNYVDYIYLGVHANEELGFRIYDYDSSQRPNRVSGYCFNLDGGEGNGAYYQPAGGITTNTWHQIVMIINAARVMYYFDGTYRSYQYLDQSYTGGPKITPQWGGAPLFLGTGENQSYFLNNGDQIDEVAWFNRQLSDSEISNLYATGESDLSSRTATPSVTATLTATPTLTKTATRSPSCTATKTITLTKTSTPTTYSTPVPRLPRTFIFDNARRQFIR